ncbi:hypothetical protein GOODEAATRI_018490, partial [Goodea atripinnis]
VNFESDVRSKYLELLGYDKEEVALKVDSSVSLQPLADLSLAPPADNPETAFDLIAATLQLDSTPDPDSEEPAEPGVFNSELDTKAHTGDGNVIAQDEKTHCLDCLGKYTGFVLLSVLVPVVQALLTGDFEGAVELCLHDNRMADSIILAIAGGADLLEKTQKKYFNKANSKITKDLVEKVVVLRRAVELTQLSGPAAIGTLLAEKMSQYANLLASQGSLSTAITYLPDNTNQVCNTPRVAVQQLRDRLLRALGQQTAPAQAHRAASQLPNRLTQHGSALPQPPFSQVQAMVPQPTAGAPAPGPTPGSAPSQPQYYQPVCSPRISIS